MNNKTNKSMKTGTKVILGVVVLIAAAVGFFGLSLYQTYMAPNVSGTEKYLFVRTGYSLDDLLKEMQHTNALKNIESFGKAAEKMNLTGSLKPGRYELKTGMGNRALVNMLKAGNQKPVTLKIQNIRKKENFAGYLSRNLEADSLTFLRLLDSAALVEKYGFTTENSYTMFIPNSYEMYWNTTPIAFFERMQKEYDKFWTSARRKKAEALNLSLPEVGVLASIVDAEALYDSEMPIIAGLYLNRLKKGILLQADPTVIFANNDFTVKRVTNALLNVSSRYNTYKYAGLPPGPIMMPSINAIDAVLNKDDNNYIYMCAKEDFSGYHNFAVTVQEHNANAKKYRDALNKRNIYR